MNQAIQAYQALVELCQNREIKDNAREVNELLGIISAMAASPEPLELQQWFPCLWMQAEEPSFSCESLAVDFAQAVLQFYQHCLLNYQQAKPLSLPTSLWLKEQQITAQGSAFASGYLSGFQYNEQSWQALNLPPESEQGQLLQTTILLLSKMANPNSSDPQMQALFMQLPDMQEIVNSLPQLLSVLGHFSVVVEHHE
jgi:yecA family protein